MSADLQKGIEDLKRTIDRLKSREKQIIKDAQQTEVEVQQFQLQKQTALNQISVVVPLRISQIYMFNTSGSLTGPTDKPVPEGEENLEVAQNCARLKDPTQRSLVSEIGLKTHTLFSNRLVNYILNQGFIISSVVSLTLLSHHHSLLPYLRPYTATWCA